jgi:hypothetical protein
MNDYAFDDLVRAWRRYRALADAFGADLDAPPQDQVLLHGFACKADAETKSTGSPFDDLLEAPESIHRLYQRHAARIRESQGEARDAAVHDLVRDALATVFPEAAGRTVAGEAVRA